MPEMIAIRRVPDSFIERITYDTAVRRRVSAIDPQPGTDVFEVIAELLLAHAWFDNCIAQFFIDLMNPIHSFEDKNNCTLLQSEHGSVAPIVSSAESPYRGFEIIAQPNDARNLVSVFR
jgi:hypothetical protein